MKLFKYLARIILKDELVELHKMKKWRDNLHCVHVADGWSHKSFAAVDRVHAEEIAHVLEKFSEYKVTIHPWYPNFRTPLSR